MDWRLDYYGLRLGQDRGTAPPFVTLKDVLWLLYLYPVRALARLAPPSTAHTAARAFAPLFQLMRRPQRDFAAERISHTLGLDEAHCRRVARRFVAHAVRRAADDLALTRLGDRPVPRTTLRGRENLDQALAAGKGVLLLTGHFYANRAAKHHLRAIGCPVLSVRNGVPPDGAAGRLGRNRFQRRYVEFLHSVIRDEVLIQDPECSLRILRRLRSGGLVNVHFDAAFAAERTEMPFLGVPRLFGTGILDIVRLSGCEVVPMQCLGSTEDLSIVFDAPLAVVRGGTREAFLAANLPLFVRTLEAQVREHPDEWELWVRL